MTEAQARKKITDLHERAQALLHRHALSMQGLEMAVWELDRLQKQVGSWSVTDIKRFCTAEDVILAGDWRQR